MYELTHFQEPRLQVNRMLARCAIALAFCIISVRITKADTTPVTILDPRLQVTT
jgi:hypothetical protein